MEEVWENSDPEELYVLDTVIGYGHFGKVYKAKQKETGDAVAIKILPVVEDDDDAKSTLRREIKLMKECDSQHIVKFYGSYLKGSELWIVMEYCDGGSLANIMAKLAEPLSEQEIQVVMRHMLVGLEFLHSKRMIHRDIKADNVLITSEGQAKLADLGVAAKLSNTMENRSTATGTPYWMAPELIKEEAYTSEVDIWSLGITAIELAERKPPFFDMVPMRALFVIATGDKPSPTLQDKDKWSKEFHNFIAQCLVKDPKLRATAKTLLDDPFITKSPPESILKDYCLRYIEFKEMKQAEKDLKKQNRSQPSQPSNAIDRLKDFNSNSIPNTPAPTATLLPVCRDCGLYKEPIVWEGLPFKLPKRKHTLANVSNQQRLNIDKIDVLINMMVNPKSGVERKTRTYRLRSHKDCFAGSEAVDWLVDKLKITRDEGVAIAESLMHRGFIYHVLKCEPFQDNKNIFYRFSNNIDLDKEHLENAAKMTYLADMMRWGIDIKDRRWKHKNYIMTFLGNEAVDWLMRTLLIQNRNEAIEIAQIMMDRSIIHHVNFVEVFSDKPTLYRFFRDDGKYEIVSSHIRSSAFEKANVALIDAQLVS